MFLIWTYVSDALRRYDFNRWIWMNKHLPRLKVMCGCCWIHVLSASTALRRSLASSFSSFFAFSIDFASSAHTYLSSLDAIRSSYCMRKYMLGLFVNSRYRHHAGSMSPNSTWLLISRHDTTRHVRRIEPMHFGCVKLVEQHARLARHARHVELDWLDTFDTTSTTGATRNLHVVCCVICIKLWYVSYSLIYWSIHSFNLFYLTEQIGFCVCKSIKND